MYTYDITHSVTILTLFFSHDSKIAREINLDATTYLLLHLSICCTSHNMSSPPIFVHSLISSVYFRFGLPLFLDTSTIPCIMVLVILLYLEVCPNHFNLRRHTVCNSGSIVSISSLILFLTNTFFYLLYTLCIVVFCEMYSRMLGFSWLCKSSVSMIHRHKSILYNTI